VNRVRAVQGDVLLFSSGHFLRMLAMRWIGADVANGNSFMLSAASLSALGDDNGSEQPVVLFWNDTHHLLTTA
jgi:broad specificity phosphatase PhoE